MQDNVQRELLLAFTSHGLAAQEEGAAIVVPAGELIVESRVTNFPSTGGKHMLCVDVATYSPRLGKQPIVESFAGFGVTQREAVGMAFSKFLLGTFHTLIESLSDHTCAENQAEPLSWQGSQTRWSVFCGPIVSQSEPDGEAISEQCRSLVSALEPIYLRKANAGSHWFRVFVGVFQGQVQSIEVLFDNEPWAEAEALCRSWEWVTPQSYASARVFAVAMAA